MLPFPNVNGGVGVLENARNELFCLSGTNRSSKCEPYDDFDHQYLDKMFVRISEKNWSYCDAQTFSKGICRGREIPDPLRFGEC